MTAAIRTEQLTKRYGHTTALDGLDLEIEQGEVFGYLGPNGAGQVDDDRAAARPDPPDVGRGTDLRPRRRGATPGDPPPARVRARARRTSGRRSPAPRRCGSSAQLHGSVDDGLPRRARRALRARRSTRRSAPYSHGNRQKVLLIAAFASRADLLLLDEPTTGLDPLMEQVFRTCVREARDRGQTVLLSSHILSEVEAVCDRVAMLRARPDHRDRRARRAPRPRRAARPRRARRRRRRTSPAIAGVSNVVVDGHTVECDVTGSMEPLLPALADAGVAHMTTREPSLEELFMSHYGDAPRRAAALR